MANHKAAKKSIRSDERKRKRNRYQLTSTRTHIKKLLKIKDHEEATKLYPLVCSMIDKLSKRNIIHKNNAAHRKSKLAKYVNSLASSS